MAVADFSLKDQVSLVTGRSKGIGRAIALALAEHGADIAITARGQDTWMPPRRRSKPTGRRCLAFSADLADDGALGKLHETTVSELGVVDILVNNAGTADVFGTRDMPYERC